MNFPWILIIIIVVGSILGLFEFYIHKKNRRTVNYLNGDYKKAYSKLTIQIGSSYLSYSEQKDVMQDIATMLYDAQDNNKPISEIIGMDSNKFVNSILRSFGYKKHFALLILEGIRYMLFIVIVVQCAIYNIRPTQTIYEATVGYPLIAYMIILSFILLPITKYSLTKRKVRFISIPILIIVLFELLYIFRKRLFDVGSVIDRFFEGEVSLIPNIAILLILMVALITTFIVKYAYRYNIRKGLNR
jgi:DNA-binding ferritin-like protein (Dps family)